MTKRRPKVLTHERFAHVRQPDATEQELSTVREIAHALAHADRPDEVFQFALDRTSALIGASFASVYLVEGVSELMRLVAASNWPERHRPWLSEVRVRLGFGPSGEAAAERRVIEVPDVLADGGLEDWAEVARELGFRSLVALPLQDARSALGAVTFYFAGEGTPTAERRQLMRLVADQMAAAASRARLVADLRRATAALLEAREEVDRANSSGTATPRGGDDLAERIVAGLIDPVSAVTGLARELRAALPASAADTGARICRDLDRIAARVDDWHEYFVLRGGGGTTVPEAVQPRDVALAATALADEWVGGAGVVVKLLPGDVRPIVTDRKKITRILASLLVFADTRAPGASVSLVVTADDSSVHLVVQDAGSDLGREQMDALFDPVSAPEPRGRHQASLAVVRELILVLGGTLSAALLPGQGLQLKCSLPISSRT